MSESKTWYSSLTVWSGALAALASVLALIFRVSITDVDVRETSQQLATMGAAVSAVIAVIGRVRATKRIGSTAAVVVLLLLPLCGGCASYPFTQGVQKPGKDFAGELRVYANRDASLDTATRAQYIAVADALENATKDNVTLEGVKSAWAPFTPLYGPQVDADQLLDADEKALRAQNVARFDGLIAAESRRWIYPQFPTGP